MHVSRCLLSVHSAENGYLTWGIKCGVERNWPQELTIPWLKMLPF